MTAQHVRRSHDVRLLSQIFQKWRENVASSSSSHSARQSGSDAFVKDKNKLKSRGQRERDIREVRVGGGCGLRDRECVDVGVKEKSRKSGEKSSRGCDASGLCVSHSRVARPGARLCDETSSSHSHCCGVSEDSESESESESARDRFSDDANTYYHGVCDSDSDTERGYVCDSNNSNADRNGPAA